MPAFTSAPVLGLMLAALAAAHAALPSYIHACKRNDRHLDNCILTAVEKLRPQLVKGIPELDCPPLEPLVIPEVVVALGASNFKAIGKKVLVSGGSKFKVNKLKVDLSSLTFAVGLTLDQLEFSANYEADLRIGSLPIRAQGPLRANASGVECEAVLHGKLQKREGVEYMVFPGVDIDLQINGFHTRIDNVFPDPLLNEANNRLINENYREILKTLQPIVERTVGNVVLDIANKITRNIPYEELFPKGD